MASVLDQVLSQVAGIAHRAQRVLKRVAIVFLSVFILATLVPVRSTKADYGSFVTNAIGHSASAWVVQRMESSLLPGGTHVIILGPWDAFMVIAYVGVAIGILATMPYILFLLLRPGWDGLRPSEQRVIRTVIPASIGLFLAGGAFAWYLLPPLYVWSIALQSSVGGSGTVGLTEFVLDTLVFVGALGISFELPLLAWGLASAGVIRSSLIRAHWKGAVMAAWVAPLLITSGAGGGVIEIPLGFLFCGFLYVTYRVVQSAERSRSRRIAARAAAVAG